MIVSSESAEFLTTFQVLALLGGQVGVERQLGHADDAVHRRADFVAHVGQELALGAVGRLGAILRFNQLAVDPAQFRCAYGNLLFQTVAVNLEVLVALLDFAEHLVEAAIRQPDFVVVLLAGPDAIVLEECHRFGGLRQVNHGIGDEALEAAGQEKRGEAGYSQHCQCDEGGVGPPFSRSRRSDSR